MRIKAYVKAILYSRGQMYIDFSKDMGKTSHWFSATISMKNREHISFRHKELVKMAKVLNIPEHNFTLAIQNVFIPPKNFFSNELKSIKTRKDIYYFLTKVGYFEHISPTTLDRCVGRSDYDLGRALVHSNNLKVRLILQRICLLLDLDYRRLISIMLKIPYIPYKLYTHQLTVEQQRLQNYIKSYLFIRGTSLTQLSRVLHHGKDWIVYRLYYTKNKTLQDNTLKRVARILDIEYSSLRKILNGDPTPLTALQTRMYNNVHDRRTLLDLFMVASYLHGTKLNYISVQTGHRGKYLGHSIKKRSQQTLLKQLSPVAEQLGIPNLRSLLSRAKIFVAKAKGMNGHDPVVTLSRKDRVKISKVVTKIIWSHSTTYRKLDPLSPFFSISSEIHKGSRRGIVKVLAWLTVKLNEDLSHFDSLFNNVDMKGYHDTYMNDVNYYKKRLKAD